MSDIKLNREELAALDLLIESMKAEQQEGSANPQKAWPAVTARVARAAVKAVRRVTRAGRPATDWVNNVRGAPVQKGTQQEEEQFDEVAAQAAPELSLEELIELRQVAKPSDE